MDMMTERENAYVSNSNTVFELLDRFREDDRIAIACGSEEISYRMFIRAYRILGGKLVRAGLNKGDRVLLCMSRGIGYLTAMFGIMAAGGVYIPVDSEWPKERRQFIIRDSAASLMITNDGICLPDGSAACHEPGWETGLSGINISGKEIRLPDISGQDFCMGYYTSGTSGLPKCTTNVHEVMYNNALYCHENFFVVYTVSSCRNVLAMLNLAYSYSLLDIQICLCNGLKLILATEEECRDPSALGHCMKRWNVDALSATPSVLERYLEKEIFQSAFRNVKRVGLSGECLNRRQMEYIIGKTDGNVFNGYGSSEMLHCSDAFCTAEGKQTIGLPNHDVCLYVLKDDLESAKAGDAGELYVGGTPAKYACYLGREELNQEKYLCHPSFGRLFRTGDAALVLENGEIEISGRCDGVMKLHGQRLDPGEIEQTMEQYPGLCKGVVQIQGKGADAVLCAFYTVRGKVDPAKLRKWLSERLPHFMVPVFYKELPEFLLNTNGKLDRSVLPLLGTEVGHAGFEAPRDEREALLCDLFQEVLETGQPVGTGDSFFSLGGDSISGMCIVSKARNKGWNLELSSLFGSPVVKDLAHTLTPLKKTSDLKNLAVSGIKDSLSPAEKAAIMSCVSQEKVQAVYPFLPAMMQHLRYQEGREWDASEMRNIKVPVDIEKLKSRYAYLMSRRAALRSCPVFPEEGRPLAVVLTDPDNPLTVIDLKDMPDDGLFSDCMHADAQTFGVELSKRQFEYINSHLRTYRRQILNAGKPAVQTGIIRVDSENWIIYILYSHYVLDGTGAHRIMEELLEDTPLSDDMQDYDSFYRNLASDVCVKEGLEYWKVLTEHMGYTKLPKSAEALSLAPSDGPLVFRHRISMDRILSYGQIHGVTMAALIHTAIGMALADITGHDRVSFATIGNGRAEPLTDDERLTGAFSSEMPVVYKKGDLIVDIQKQLIKSWNHNVFDFELLGNSFSGEDSITGTVTCDILNYREAKGTAPDAYNIIRKQYQCLPEGCRKNVLITFVPHDDLVMTCMFYPAYADPETVSKFFRCFTGIMNQLMEQH